MITVKLEITTKINQLPQAKTLENSWQQFNIDCDGRIISVTKPKVWKKLTDTASNYPQWVATITLQLGQQTDNRFVLDEPNIQASFSAQAKTRSNSHAWYCLSKGNHTLHRGATTP